MNAGSRRRAGRRLALVGLLAAAGCSSLLDPRPDESRFFVLDPGAATTTEEQVFADGGPSVGLGPVRLPEYLRRPEWVVRTGASEIRPSATDRWGESLDQGLPRVLARELARELGSPSVTLHPWYRRSRPDYQVLVDVQQFEADTEQRAVLSARWEVRALGEGDRRLYGQSRLVREASSNDTADLIAALHAALGDLASELARVVKQIAVPQAALPQPE